MERSATSDLPCCFLHRRHRLTHASDLVQLSRLDESPLSTKLAHLFAKSYFPLALSVGKSQAIGKDGLADIHRRYGDHLYSKGDYEGAVGQYVKTLGELQPSYVIRKVRLAPLSSQLSVADV